MSVEDLSAEREEALAAARRIVGGNQRSLTGYFEEGDPLAVARALLASAARVEGLERALEDCAESLSHMRDRNHCGEGDHKDRKADASDPTGSLYALQAARAALAKEK